MLIPIEDGAIACESRRFFYAPFSRNRQSFLSLSGTLFVRNRYISLKVIIYKLQTINYKQKMSTFAPR